MIALKHKDSHNVSESLCVFLLSYNHAAPTMINKMNNTTINANPPAYAPLIITPPFISLD